MTEKEQMMKDAALVALKRQAEWHDMPQPTAPEIERRINQVCQYDAGNDATLIAMKDLVLLQLSMKLEVMQLRDALTARALWSRVKRLFGRAI